MGKAYVIGVGSTKFDKPRGLREYDDLGVEAAVKALIDAGITYDQVESAAAGYVYGDSTCGQRVLYQLGMTGIPIVNVNNNCSTGSSAFILAVQSVVGGQAECALAVGFERMAPGSLGSAYKDRLSPTEGTNRQLVEIENSKNYATKESGPGAGRIFGAGGLEYCEKYGATQEHMYKISAKNHAHSAKNPYSQFRFTPTWEEVAKSRKITRELTLPMCSPTSDGGAAAVVASEAFVKKHGLEDRAVEVAGWALTTDAPMLYDAKSRIELTGADMARRAAKKAYAMAGVTPADIQVVELHDCFAPNELLTYDSLGLCKPGEAHKIVDAGDNTYGGKWVVNPSGGLESKGHPLGATGLGMIFYLTLQVRGEAGNLQVPNVRNALQHNLGLGGACVVTVLRKPSFYKKGSTSADRYGYNVANEVRGITKADLNKVRAKLHSDYIPVKVQDAARL
ncbi:putative sterol carrier protein [Cutaneotrichosporon oleaginosum]|uniref:Putative sterol carrier protein n=1 Tax=Cutaneotrichosporon oleaginosum TaxID=879819 RepID=A0A0J0XN39_9TREE|nr:putative sterol carrier protein [Cutaneotrichosporon oleaginosum]KLT42531.1 putative sterol carrier protein [Cutaneotrichosporon oleaginosum]